MNFNDAQVLHLRMSKEDQALYKKNKAKFNKFISHNNSKARNNAKRKTCYTCNEPYTSFCNSHSVPKFCLKGIAVDGKVRISGLQEELPIMGEDSGVEKAGTFHLICRHCDSTLFQDYENPNAYSIKPTGKILAQIAMKNYLQVISERLFKKELYKIIRQDYPDSQEEMNYQIATIEMDLLDYQDAYKRAKTASSGNHDEWYYLCYYQKLNYVVPVATQSSIALISDFEDNVINNLYDFPPNYKLQEINVAIFPLENESVVMLFIDSRNKRYRNFYKQLNNLPLPDQLAAINYIVLSYTENVFLSPKIDESVFKNPNFLSTCQKSTIVLSNSIYSDSLKAAIDAFTLSKRNSIPNLLSKDFSL